MEKLKHLDDAAFFAFKSERANTLFSPEGPKALFSHTDESPFLTLKKDKKNTDLHPREKGYSFNLDVGLKTNVMRS